MGSKAPKGPSSAELRAIAQQEEAPEMAKLKQQQDFEREKIYQQMAFDREVAAQKMNELKLQSELQNKAYQENLAKEQKAEQDRFAEARIVDYSDEQAGGKA